MTQPTPDAANLNDGEYLTYQPSITEWTHGEARERIVVPAGEITDYSSIPDKGALGFLARKLGFDKNAPCFTRSGKIHDMLYYYLKTADGVLPPGWYEFFNPLSQQWQPMLDYQWTREQADAIWERISIEDGCNPKVAALGYRMLRLFGGLHMLLR